ncbi:MAG: hypothetical protein R3E79_13430 [Caldilineaceae bacterium]
MAKNYRANQYREPRAQVIALAARKEYSLFEQKSGQSGRILLYAFLMAWISFLSVVLYQLFAF